ncbi:MAG: hypothetical protein J6R85_05885 [Lentisphaeria bacterium]|nr:hypothetical protein [Lentisphaeria bacterium]
MTEDEFAFISPEIPDYRIFGRCGKGGGGTVWAAWDAASNPRAVKVIPVDPEVDPERFSAGLRAVSAFAAASQHNRYLIQIYHIGVGEGFWYYVMDLADNRYPGNWEDRYEPDSLALRLRNDEIGNEDIFRVIRNVLDGVEGLHKSNIAHCDLKPDNVIFVQGEVRICDPGLVCPGGQNICAGTEDYHPLGDYNAFECDIYALGKILYQLYSGYPVQKFPALPGKDRLPGTQIFNHLALRCCIPDRRRMFHSVNALSDAVDPALPVRWQKNRNNGNRLTGSLRWSAGLLLLIFLRLRQRGALFRSVKKKTAEGYALCRQKCAMIRADRL